MRNSTTTLEDVRKEAMGLMARSRGTRLATLVSALGTLPDRTTIRGPETGLVTVRGRMGGGGAPFNVGETTVTRATVKLASGSTGHAYALGRDHDKALLAATVDALLQDGSLRTAVERDVLQPLRDDETAEVTKLREEAAATRVDFFTMVRGED